MEFAWRLECEGVRACAERARSIVYTGLKGYRGSASRKMIEPIGCDIHWLRAWLEIQFRSGMSWHNYGPVWHVDHKRPIATWNLSNPLEFKRCFHWTNLQPLFASENFRKARKSYLNS